MPSASIDDQQRLRSLPAGSKACIDGWTETDLEHESCDVFEEDDFFESFVGNCHRDTFDLMAKAVNQALVSRGLTVNSSNIFKFLLQPALALLLDYTNQELVRTGHTRMEEKELLQFIGTKHLRSTFNLSTGTAFEAMKPLATSEGFVLMEARRHNAMLHSLRGHDVIGRDPAESEDSWMERHNLLCRMVVLERRIFQNSVTALLNKKNGFLVVDDELVPSRAGDVELKTVSNRKSGKEGPIADCIACSQTSVVFGMKLRTKGITQENNVQDLLSNLPNMEQGSNTTITFDRGYGKMNFVLAVAAVGFNVWTVAATVGSRHPFIADDEIKEFKKRLVAKKVEAREIDRRMQLVSDWVVDGAESLGSEARVAKKQLPNHQWLCATAARDVFDRKADSKSLRFFSSGQQAVGLGNAWVAIRKKSTALSLILFSSGKPSNDKEETETLLRHTCEPLTLGQRCADWFPMKSQKLTGTMAGKIMNVTVTGSVTDLLPKLLEDCIGGWHGRFKSSLAMQRGTSNEAPTAHKFSLEPFVKSFFEVGLLQNKEFPHLGVSPDGAVMLTNGLVACVEIKTRVGESTIEKAVNLSKDKGRIVHCSYNDPLFKECVPAEHRAQVLHQAFVCGLSCGVHVVSKVEEGSGCIVQVVIATVAREDKESHKQQLLLVSTPLLAWLCKRDVIDKGHLEDEDFPPWVMEQQKKVLSSRCKLFHSHCKKVTTTTCDGDPPTPLKPVLLHKQGTQHIHNKGKPGLDKNTEQERRIKLYSNIHF